MNILIADDHPLFVEGLKNLLQSNGFHIVGIVANGEEAVAEALAKKPDIIMMDIAMPVMNGIEATKCIKSKLPETRIVILTSFEEEDSLFRAIKAGASGYLFKSIEGGELIRGLYDIANGKNPFSAGLTDSLLSGIQQNIDFNKEGSLFAAELSDRQLEVVKLLSKGHTYREIGKKLFLSERTIKYHMEQIKGKLDLKTQAQVIAYARDKLKF